MTVAKPVALVTGAGGRIGRATCIVLAHDHVVVATDVDPTALGETADRLGHGHATFEVDLRSLPAIEDLVGRAAALGSLRVLVNNAASLEPGGSVEECSEGQFADTMAINVRAPFFAMRAVIPYMRSAGGGSIINVASVLGLAGLPGFSAYSASKGALIALTRQAAVEYASQGLRINAVCPGTVLRGAMAGQEGAATDALRELHPMGRTAEPEEIARVIAFLASDEASFITGAIVPIDGGWTAR